jgi:hypothetical protein
MAGFALTLEDLNFANLPVKVGTISEDVMVETKPFYMVANL